MLESRLIQTEGGDKFQRLLYQLEMSKKRANSLAHDLQSQQRLLKTTSIQEVRVENEIYKQELVRLRTMLEKGLGGGIRFYVKNKKQRDNSEQLKNLLANNEDLE